MQTVRIEGLKLWPLSIDGLETRLAERTEERDAARARAVEWAEAHAALIADVAAKRRAAAEADRANAERVAREMDEIRERTADAYQDRLDDTRAALDRVRGQLAAIDAAAAEGDSDGGAPAVPAGLTARCRAFGAADCDALLDALPDLLAEAETNTGKLIALQGWARSILAVDFEGEAQ